MAIHLRQNQYRGVNAHLHSALQNEPGDWEMFHAAHIVDIAEALDAQLHPRYEVKLARSIQLKEYHPDTGEPIKPPDTDQTLQDDEAYLTAILISEISEAGKRTVVNRIELLLPNSKPPAQASTYYVEQRKIALLTGVTVIEIDYLHQSPSTFNRLPSYPEREIGSHPYSLVVLDARPSFQEGMAHVYSFDVDNAIPCITLPLVGPDLMTFDLNPVYNQTFERLSYFSNRVDYEQQPVRFDTYSEADQQRIKARMAAVIEAHKPD